MQEFQIKFLLFAGFCFFAPLFSGQGPKCPKARARQNCFQRDLNAFGGSSEGKSEKKVADFFKGAVGKCYSENMGNFLGIMHNSGSYLAVGRNGATVISARSGDVSNVGKQDECYVLVFMGHSRSFNKVSFAQCKSLVDRAVPPKRAERK